MYGVITVGTVITVETQHYSVSAQAWLYGVYTVPYSTYNYTYTDLAHPIYIYNGQPKARDKML